MTYMKMGKTQEARKAFNKATSLNPNMKTVISQLTKRN
jgi:Flp pilus assembly protein TadD